ncbi:hypothetical protein CHS0354_025502 [Potamilus streckersoni]|uniref:Uncharacterized protein n=1 Tax=Potamilus streckersoni TaxID=2493646 RepID=A0AAE0SKX8_9BIVA|nr:hypothetical protein CHS0354_025502 [Potamilus streckersoni]
MEAPVNDTPRRLPVFIWSTKHSYQPAYGHHTLVLCNDSTVLGESSVWVGFVYRIATEEAPKGRHKRNTTTKRPVILTMMNGKKKKLSATMTMMAMTNYNDGKEINEKRLNAKLRLFIADLAMARLFLTHALSFTGIALPSDTESKDK